jgi:hypothetical protein
MADKDSLAWKLGDGLIPDPLRTKLYTNWFEAEVTPDINVELNYWSWMHFLSGMMFALAFPQATFLIWMIIHFIWELYQITIGMSDIKNKPASEMIDISFDTIFAAGGFGLVYVLKK